MNNATLRNVRLMNAFGAKFENDFFLVVGSDFGEENYFLCIDNYS